ncbi:hypothetical protein P692DRAFT_20575674 [Suillus brevipes Sb2]|nr:hypothetical protein P692DRAFT_20575674 [Suillus brevipes Sb2]
MPNPLPSILKSKPNSVTDGLQFRSGTGEFMFWSAQDPCCGATVRKPEAVASTKMLDTSYRSRELSHNKEVEERGAGMYLLEDLVDTQFPPSTSLLVGLISSAMSGSVHNVIAFHSHLCLMLGAGVHGHASKAGPDGHFPPPVADVLEGNSPPPPAADVSGGNSPPPPAADVSGGNPPPQYPSAPPCIPPPHQLHFQDP